MKRLHELVTILHFMQKLDKSWGSIPPRSTSTRYILYLCCGRLSLHEAFFMTYFL